MGATRPPELLQGTLDMMILRTLSIQQNHGYGIARRIRQSSGDVLHVEEGSLYPALHRLEKRGYVRSNWQRSESNRRAKYYRLTTSGRTKLKRESARWGQLSAAIGKVMGATQSQAATMPAT